VFFLGKLGAALLFGDFALLQLRYVNGASPVFFGKYLDADAPAGSIKARFVLGIIENIPDRLACFRVFIVKLFTGQVVFHHVKGREQNLQLIFPYEMQFQNHHRPKKEFFSQSLSWLAFFAFIIIIRRVVEKIHTQNSGIFHKRPLMTVI
jgi:hypothetical protein